MRLLLIITAMCLLGLGISPSQAGEIYKTVDEDGRVTYSDKPPRQHKGDKAELPPVNAMEKTDKPRNAPRNSVPTSQTEQATDYQLSLTSPEQDAQLPPGQRDLVIRVELNPPLAPEHQLVYYMDGEEIARGRNSQYRIEEIFRGTHQIRVVIVNQRGQILKTSDTRQVHVHRPSLLLGPGS